MGEALVESVRPGSPAERAGVRPGDVLRAVDGVELRDVIEYRWLVDGEDPVLWVEREGRSLEVRVEKAEGELLGIELRSPVFDEVVTCDNACDFCFVHQLPRGLRKSLYVKDDDYRLSFLYGNYTTLTRFTELDLERIVEERLGPLNVSIHTTDPYLRARMLRNPKGASSLRWLELILEAGIEVHGQIVVCPGVNDGAELENTFCGILDRFAGLASCCVVPVGVSRFNRAPGIRPHTASEARAVVEMVEHWQEVFLECVGRRLVHAADEFYLRAGMDFPPADHYEGFPMYEDGVGMARLFEEEFLETRRPERLAKPDFFRWVDGAPAWGYRAARMVGSSAGRTEGEPLVVTSELGASVLRPMLDKAGFSDVVVLPVENRFFGGNVAVTGLLTGADLSRALQEVSRGARILLPDVCLSDGRFLDGLELRDLPRQVEVVETDGRSFRAALES